MTTHLEKCYEEALTKNIHHLRKIGQLEKKVKEFSIAMFECGKQAAENMKTISNLKLLLEECQKNCGTEVKPCTP